MAEITKVDPAAIEPLSFKIIEEEVGEHGLKPNEWAVVRRLIHTTADFDFIKWTRFHPQGVSAGITAITNGAAIVADTRMAQAGITKRHLAPFGCKVHCFIDDPEVADLAKTENTTRAAAAVHRDRRAVGGVLRMRSASSGASFAITTAITTVLRRQIPADPRRSGKGLAVLRDW